MPTATPARATRPAMPTLDHHLEGCPANPARQEVWIGDLHRRDGAITGQTGVAHCLDCGKVEKTTLKQVQAYLAWTEPQENVNHG